METKAPAQRPPFIAVQSESLALNSRAESAADIQHSKENILQWMSYLPDDCIRTMVLMGWDITT